jgi:hypothetical protein
MTGMGHGEGPTTLMWLGLGLVVSQLGCAGAAALSR